MYTCSSSMAKSLTIFSCFTFWRTSNSRIWTSWGRMWESWLNVLTATDSPLCLFTPYKKVHIKLPELKCFSHGLFKLFGISKKSCFHRFLFLENWPEILLRWLPCLRRWLCTKRSWRILVRTTSFRQACSRSPHQWLIWKTKTTNAYHTKSCNKLSSLLHSFNCFGNIPEDVCGSRIFKKCYNWYMTTHRKINQEPHHMYCKDASD